MEPVTCSDKTFSVRVKSTVSGVTYAATQTSGYSSSLPGTGGDIIFSGLTFGDGFSVSATNGDGCTSGATTCGNSSSSQQSSSIHTEPSKGSIKALAAPNPFNDRIRFTLQSSVSGKGSVALYNLMGQKVATVFQGYVQKGQVQTIEYSVPGSQRTNLIYVFSVGDQRTSGKLIGLK